MKREIKFRAWNGHEMVYDVTVGRFGAFYVNPGDKGNGLDPNDSASLTPFNTKYFDTTPVMQYTGLYDKNLKEIYEDDVVRIFFSNGTYTDIKIKCGNAVWTIHCYANMGQNTREVIGNIYENPELLNSEQEQERSVATMPNSSNVADNQEAIEPKGEAMGVQPGMRWVKASERVPNNSFFYHIKIEGTKQIGQYRSWCEDWINCEGDYFPNDQIEWLDEFSTNKDDVASDSGKQ